MRKEPKLRHATSVRGLLKEALMPLSTAHSMSKETQLTRMDRDSFAGRWTPRMLSILRIVAAFMFMQHGAQKLFGFLGPANATAPELF